MLGMTFYLAKSSNFKFGNEWFHFNEKKHQIISHPSKQVDTLTPFPSVSFKTLVLVLKKFTKFTIFESIFSSKKKRSFKQYP